MKIKCKIKYFWDGFSKGLVFTRKPVFRKYCPYCCSRISNEEYNNDLTFKLGCQYCRDKEIEKEYLLFGFTEKTLMEMEDRLSELE